MKYLIGINERYNKEVCERTYKPLINWNMISDLKDMSLEYLDNGYKLRIEIYYKSKIKYETVCVMGYSHDKKCNYFCWSSIAEYCVKFPNKNKLYYSFKLHDSNKLWKSLLLANKELKDRIKEAYPDMIKNLPK